MLKLTNCVKEAFPSSPRALNAMDVDHDPFTVAVLDFSHDAPDRIPIEGGALGRRVALPEVRGHHLYRREQAHAPTGLIAP